MKFIIEQIALCPENTERARKLLAAIGIEDWAEDQVHARGQVRGQTAENKANLAFNYKALEKARELEILNYVEGDNWIKNNIGSVSHFGMHCSSDELDEWRKFFASLGVSIAQEVCTVSHSNPVIAGKRWYNYVIFETRHIIGVDLKFIIRKDSCAHLSETEELL